MNDQTDPKLKAAMEEIKAILKKHDLAGVVILNTPDVMEHLFHLQASWNCFRIDGNLLRANTTTFPQDKKREVLENSISLCCALSGVLGALQADADKAVHIFDGFDFQHIARKVG